MTAREISPRPSVTAAELDVGWMVSAACRSADTAQFFPEGRESIDAARAICRTCPVTRECLAYALSVPNTTGVWGGTSEDERERMKRGMRRRNRSRVL